MRIETLDGKTIEARPQQLLNYQQFTNGRVQGYLNECEVKYDDVSGNVYLDTGMMYFQGLAIYVETPQIMFHENDINNLSYVFIVIDNGELSFDTFSNVDMVKVDDILNDPYGKVEIPLALIEKDTLSNKIIDITQTYKYSRKKLSDKPVLGTFNKDIYSPSTKTFIHSLYLDGYEYKVNDPNYSNLDLTGRENRYLVIRVDPTTEDYQLVWVQPPYEINNRRTTLNPYFIDSSEEWEIIVGQVKYDSDIGDLYIDYFVDNIYDTPFIDTLDTGWNNMTYASGVSYISQAGQLKWRVKGNTLYVIGGCGGTFTNGIEFTISADVIPEQYRPIQIIRTGIGANVGRTYGYMMVDSNGLVRGIVNVPSGVTMPTWISFSVAVPLG